METVLYNLFHNSYYILDLGSLETKVYVVHCILILTSEVTTLLVSCLLVDIIGCTQRCFHWNKVIKLVLLEGIHGEEQRTTLSRFLTLCLHTRVKSIPLMHALFQQHAMHSSPFLVASSVKYKANLNLHHILIGYAYSNNHLENNFTTYTKSIS